MFDRYFSSNALMHSSMPPVPSSVRHTACPNVRFLAWPYPFLSEDIRRLAGLVSAIAKFDEDDVGDEGSNVSANPDSFVIRALGLREGDLVGGLEAPAPLPRNDKIEFVPSTGVPVLRELPRVLRRGWLMVESEELSSRRFGPFKPPWLGKRWATCAGPTATRRACGSSNTTNLTHPSPCMAIIDSSV